MSLSENYLNDLKRSRKTCYLMEVSRKDVDGFEGGDSTVLGYALKAYNMSDKLSSVIVIDGDNNTDKESFYLLNAIIDLLKDDIQGIKNLEAIKAGIKMLLPLISGGLFSGPLTEAFVDKVGEFLPVEKAVEYLVEDVIDTGFESLEETAHEFVIDEVIEKFKKANSLELTHGAKKQINEIASMINSELEVKDIIICLFRILLATGIGNPKLIFVKNPHKLDKLSLSFLMLLFSHAKDKGQHIGLSVVYYYADPEFQPYQELKKTSCYGEVKGILDEQRRFIQRYGMLERPGTTLPQIAVKASDFVGRENELNRLANFYKAAEGKAKIAIIKGEPGIGKTALIKKHIERVRSETKKRSICLTIHNEPGSATRPTGLTSLEYSIIEEAKRLDEEQSIADILLSKVKNMFKKPKKSLFSIVSRILGADKLIDTGIKSMNAYNSSKDLENVKVTSKNIGKETEDQKEKYFASLNDAVKQLIEFSDSKLPIILFIDDVQWINESAAEYLLTHFIPKFCPYVLVSQRYSDSMTRLKELKEDSYIKKMLELKDISNAEGKYEEELKGFDKPTLGKLLDKIIQFGDENNKKQILADAIIKSITPEKDIENNLVNTLFCIETINLLCDLDFYSNNDSITPIVKDKILQSDDNEDFEDKVNKIFTYLKEKYSGSMNKIPQSGSFTLMSYAVLEERLVLLKRYFQDSGNAALNTLLLSSLLGVPFHSSLIGRVLDALKESERATLEELKTRLFNAEDKVTLTEEQYYIIDQMYEILRRYPQIQKSYIYRHNLLNIFLYKQMEYLLDSTLKDNEKNDFFSFLLLQVDTEEREQPFSLKEQNKEPLSSEEAKLSIFLKETRLNILKKAYEYDKENWAEGYTTSLINLANTYNKQNKLEESLKFYKEALEILKPLYEENRSQWAEDYATSLNNLAVVYAKQNKTKEALTHLEEARKIRKDLYDGNPSRWAKDYANSLNNLAMVYYKENNLKEAVKLYKEALEIIEPLYDGNQPQLAEDYVGILNNLALVYGKQKKTKEAIDLHEEARKILKDLYDVDQTRWAGDYAGSLNNLALGYYKENNFVKALELHEEARKILKDLYDGNQAQWTEDYAGTLNNLALVYGKENKLDEAVNHFKEALRIIKPLYDVDQTRWAGDYADTLNNLALVYCKENKLVEALDLHEEARNIRKDLYEKNRSRWAESYTTSLNNLALVYRKLKRADDAVTLLEEIRDILRDCYREDPVRWAEDYEVSLSNLTIVYNKQNREDEATKLLEVEILYKGDPARWAGNYTHSLYNLKLVYDKQNRAKESLKILEEARKVLKTAYEENSSQWAEAYTANLNVLATVYYEQNRAKESLKILEEARKVLKTVYEENSSQWAEAYTTNLNVLATVYYEQNRAGDALTHFEEARKILKTAYEENSSQWAEAYTANLNILATVYYEQNRVEDALTHFEEAKKIFKTLYEENPSQWAEGYLLILYSLASVYDKQNRTDKVLELLEEIRGIINS